MKNFILIFAVVAIATSANAQGPGQGGNRPAPPSAEEMIKNATAELGLSDEQVTQWEGIHEKYESKMKDRESMRASREEMGKELEATLTDEQLKKFKEMKKNQRPPERKKQTVVITEA